MLLACLLLALTPALGQGLPAPALLLNPADTPLHPDPAYITGALDNGLRYAIRSQPADGMLSLRLVVRAGALSEADDEPGAAFLTAMLLNEVAADQPLGRAILSLGEGLPQGARPIEPRVGYDSVSFTVSLPLANDKALALALRYLAQIAEGVGLTDQAIARHRPAILARRASMIDMRDRLRAAVFPQIVPASRVAGRATVPSDNALCTLDAERLAWFHHRRYTPSRLIVIAAGESPPDPIIRTIEQEFARLARRAVPATEPARAPLARGIRAAVASDPDLAQAIAEVAVIHPPSPPVRTVGQWRARMLDHLAVAVTRQRLDDARRAPRSPAHVAGARIGPVPGPATVAVASVGGEPHEWPTLVATLAAGVSALRRHPPTHADLDRASRALLAHLDDVEAREPAAAPDDLLDRATDAALAGDVLISPADEASLARAHLPTIRPDQLFALLADRFRLADAAFILFLPDDADAPAPADILASALPAILPDERDEPANALAAAPLPFMDEPPPPVRPRSISLDPRAAATTARFANGVNVHHRHMPGETRVSISLLLTARTNHAPPHAASAAALAFAPASATRDADQFEHALRDAGIDLRLQTLGRTLTIEANAPASRVEEALQAIHSLLVAPRVQPSALDRWRWSETLALRAAAVHPSAAADRALARLLLGDDAPFLPSSAESLLRAASPDAATTAASAFVAHASVDAAIVGDIDRPLALDLASRYLASIPGRRPSEEHPEPDTPAHPPFPVLSLSVNAADAEALVLVGIRGAPPADPARAPLELAARIIAARLDSPAAKAPPHTRSIVSRLLTDPATGRSVLFALGEIPADSAGPLAAAIERLFDDLARAGPTDAELIRARVDADDDHERDLSDPQWWARTLASSRIEGRSVADLAADRERLAAVTADAVRDALRAHDPSLCCDSPRLRIIAAPRTP